MIHPLASPPARAVSLLEHRLPAAERDAIVGDLSEEFADRVDSGRPFARLWFWAQTLLFVVRYAIARPTQMVPVVRRPPVSLLERLSTFRPAFRSVRRDPGYAIAFIVTLGLGIGATTAIFSAVDGVLMRQLPYPHADRIVMMEQLVSRGRQPFSFVEVADYRAQSKTVDEFVEYGDWSFNLVGTEEPQLVFGGLVTSNYFKVLAIRPLLGRTLQPEDDGRKSQAVVVLTYELWKRAFGANPDVIGRTIELSTVPSKIVGVLEPGSHYAGSKRAELYANYPSNTHYMSSSMVNERQHRMTSVYALVKAGVSLETARAEISAISDRLHAQYPKDYPATEAFGVSVTPWRDVLVQRARPTLLILMGAVALVLLIACANVGNLTLARLIRRERELAVRMAIGASAARVRGQLLAEHLILAVAGSGVGVLLASAALRLLVDYTARLTLRADAVRLNPVVLGFSLATGVAAAILFAWAPRLPTTDGSGHALTGASVPGRSTMNPRQRRMQRTLVSLQVAISFVVLVGAGLLVRTFANLQNISPGFDATKVVSLRAPKPNGITNWEEFEKKHRAMFEHVLAELRSYPGVVSVATTSRVPYSDGEADLLYVKADGSSFDGTTAPFQMFELYVSQDYFSTLRIPIVRGRPFTSEDRPNGAPVVLVNETFAKRVFAGTDPVGRHVDWQWQAGHWDREHPPTIVGVVRDVREIGGGDMVLPTVYRLSAQTSYGSGLLIRTAGDPATVGRDATKLIHDLDPKRPVIDVQTLESAAAEGIAPSRVNAALFSGFAFLALAIAAVGIGAVLAFSVTQRTREFGIRMALGSSHSQILTGVLNEGLTIAAAGLIPGVVAALLLTGLLQRLLYEVAAIDAMTFSAVGALLLLVTGVASWIPARRAMRVDPNVALKTS